MILGLCTGVFLADLMAGSEEHLRGCPKALQLVFHVMEQTLSPATSRSPQPSGRAYTNIMAHTLMLPGAFYLEATIRLLGLT